MTTNTEKWSGVGWGDHFYFFKHHRSTTSQLHQLLLPPGPVASLLGHLPSTTMCLLKTHVGDFYSGSGTPSSVSVVVPMVQRQLSQHLLSANMLSKGFGLVGRGAVIATNCAFFFKFLKLTKSPLYMGCKIIHVAAHPGSTLDFAVFVLSRIWRQVCDGARAPRSPSAEATMGMVTFLRGLSHDPALEQISSKCYHG